MSSENALRTISLVCVATLGFASRQYWFCRMLTDGISTVVTGGLALGVVQDTPTSGQVATVGIAGVTKVLYGGTIKAGQQVMTDGRGAIVAVGTGVVILGTALVSGSANDIGAILLGTPVQFSNVLT